MSTFNEYLNYSGNPEYSEKQLKIMGKIILSNESIEKIKSIEKEIKILAFAQVFCPDCRAIVPFLEKFSEINEKIKVEYLPRENNEELLIKYTKVAKIPTLFYVKNEEITPFLVELPNFLLEEIRKNPENYDILKYNFRIGKRNTEIEKELVNYLISL